MKNALLILLLLCSCSMSTHAQQYEAIKLSNPMPKAGKEISFNYTGVFSKKLHPLFFISFYSGSELHWIKARAKFTGDHIEGTFVIPDSTLAFSIRTINKSRSGETFVFYIYDKQDIIKGGMAAAAYLSIWESTFVSLEKPLVLYRKEFLKHPDLKKNRLLLNYLQSGAGTNDTLALQDLENTWRDSLDNSKNEIFITNLYNVALDYKNESLNKRLKEELQAKHPQSSVFLKEAGGDIFDKIWKPEFSKELEELEKRFPMLVERGEFEAIYQRYGIALFRKGLISEAEPFFEKIRDTIGKKAIYLNAASALLRLGTSLEKAETYIQKAIELQPYQRSKSLGFGVDPQEWDKLMDQSLGSYLDTYARIQFKLGKTEAALDNVTKALKLNSRDMDIMERHVTYLLASGNAKTALKMASEYLIAGKETKGIRQLIYDSYLKVHGSAENSGAYYNSLIARRDKQYILPESGKLNFPSINFTLPDLNGETFTLAEQLGKSVVLYFHNSNGIKERDADSYFNKLALEHQHRKDILFIGINRSGVIASNETERENLMLELVQNNIRKKDFKFKVLLDKYYKDPVKPSKHYFTVSDDYSSDGLSQFYVIDKKGIVRYKSQELYENNPTMMREFSAALQLLK